MCNQNEKFYLTSEELVPGSFLPKINVDPMPAVSPFYWRQSLLSILRPFSDPSVSIIQYLDPTFIPHNSSLDIINGISKFDKVITPASTGYHDVVPSDIIQPLVQALITDNLYLQNKTITSTKNYIASKTIVAGNNVTNTLPIGDFIITIGSTVEFKAGQEIILKDGFVAEEAPIFTPLLELQNVMVLMQAK